MFEKNIEIEQMFVYNKTRSEGCTYGIQRTYNRNARSCERETIKADLHPCKSIIKAEMTQPFFIWIESRNFSKTFHPFSSNAARPEIRRRLKESSSLDNKFPIKSSICSSLDNSINISPSPVRSHLSFTLCCVTIDKIILSDKELIPLSIRLIAALVTPTVSPKAS